MNSTVNSAQDNLLRAEKLSAGYGRNMVLREISFSLDRGELLVLAGPNGAGKTTLLKSLGGFIRPSAGHVFLEGRNSAELTGRERSRHRSFLFQNQYFSWPFKVREIVKQGRYPYQGWLGTEKEADREAVRRALADTALDGFEDRPITELSGGELQRVLIARSIAQEASLLLLDEPVSHLDPNHQLMIMKLIRGLAGRGTGVLLTLHDLNLASLYADRIMLLSAGMIAALGAPGDVLREDVLRDIFGSSMRVSSHPDRPSLPMVFPPAPAD
ncbi:ABC transporter ATP-binding protein [Treponema sp. OttesenSCG-928-L16]|nr:ABC transporter ATP-binding protein [Treponema sp. OttesenSCG-928-L16]